MGEHYKAEIIAGIPAGEDVSLYREGDFEDLCRGPHVPSTGKLKHFKLMKVAGAYWRGDQRNEQLQRIYGTAWATQGRAAAVPDDARRGREARPPQARPRARPVPPRRDRRRAWCSGIPRAGRCGSRSSSTCAPVYRDNGYQEVKGPQILDKSLWEKTGHWDKYRDNMFTTESEKREYALKPMNCPGHILIFKHAHQELPRPAAALWRVRPVPPQRAQRRAARHHAGARLHAGRRPHLLHGGHDPRRVRGLHGAAAEGLRRLRLHGDHLQGGHAARRSASAPTSSGTRPSSR